MPAGGLKDWARFPNGTDLGALARYCEAVGVIAPGTKWFPAEPFGPRLRLGSAGTDADRFTRAAQVVGQELLRR